MTLLSVVISKSGKTILEKTKNDDPQVTPIRILARIPMTEPPLNDSGLPFQSEFIPLVYLWGNKAVCENFLPSAMEPQVFPELQQILRTLIQNWSSVKDNSLQL